MDYESICCSLQTVRAARMFYEYGKLDRLLERDITTSSDDLYEVYYELLIAATDYMDQKFNEDYEYDHWYFSFRSMMQYYRLIREYGSLHSMKLSENPYVKKAEEMLSATLYSCCLNGGMGWGYQKKISSEWSSGLIVETDGYFHYELDLLEALLSIDAWYTEEVQKLENLLRKERALAKHYVRNWRRHEQRRTADPDHSGGRTDSHRDVHGWYREVQRGAGKRVSGLH